jgi:hypothetical protein
MRWWSREQAKDPAHASTDPAQPIKQDFKVGQSITFISAGRESSHGPSALNGDLVVFNADDVPAIKAMLAEMGYTVVERPDLRMDLEG